MHTINYRTNYANHKANKQNLKTRPKADGDHDDDDEGGPGKPANPSDDSSPIGINCTWQQLTVGGGRGRGDSILKKPVAEQNHKQNS